MGRFSDVGTLYYRKNAWNMADFRTNSRINGLKGLISGGIAGDGTWLIYMPDYHP